MDWLPNRRIRDQPEKRLVGEARIANVVNGDPDRIWYAFAGEIGCSRQEFDSYVGSSVEVFALVLDDVVRYAEPIPLRVLGECDSCRVCNRWRIEERRGLQTPR
jgi:predicted transcriptional regulator